MNREQAKLLAPVIAAFGEGKDVQYNNGYDEWITVDVPTPNFNPIFKWRIKPEPRELWAVVFDDGSGFLYYSRSAAEIRKTKASFSCEIIRVREIID